VRPATSAANHSSPPLGAESIVLPLQAGSPSQLRDAVRQGLPFSALEALTQQLQLTPQESDRVYRVARAIDQAADCLGSVDKAHQWLKSPNRALAGEIPLDWLDTEIGTRQVEDVLLRLNYGITS
jgi:uncharacterized protein (DUF2384 family)